MVFLFKYAGSVSTCRDCYILIRDGIAIYFAEVTFYGGGVVPLGGVSSDIFLTWGVSSG